MKIKAFLKKLALFVGLGFVSYLILNVMFHTTKGMNLTLFAVGMILLLPLCHRS